MGRRLGDPADPLLVSVRSGAKFSMPGMMDTVLNLGLNDKSVKGLAAATGDERFAYDSYRRFISMYGRIVLGVDGSPVRAPVRSRQAGRRRRQRRRPARRRPQGAVRDVQGGGQGGDRQGVPAGPDQAAARRRRGGVPQLERRAGDRLPRPRADQPRPRHCGQRAGDGVRQPGRQLGHGVGFTRNAATGENKPYGDFLVNAQGEDVVAGIRNTEDLDALGKHFPAIKDELLDIFARLERHYRDMCDTEFTIEQGKLWMLQTRVGKRTGAAALKMAVDMTKGTGKGPALEDLPRRGPLPGVRRPPRSGAPPAVRRQGQRDRQGSRRVAGCGGRAPSTSPPTTPRRPPSAARR